MGLKLIKIWVIVPILLGLNSILSVVAAPAVRGNLIHLSSNPTSPNPKITEGVYWVGATGMGLRVKGGQYQFYDESGEGPWKPISELKYVRDGVVLAGKTYWCLSTLPKPRNSRIVVCSANGWVQAR